MRVALLKDPEIRARIMQQGGAVPNSPTTPSGLPAPTTTEGNAPPPPDLAPGADAASTAT
jgi:hypothetical protein